MDLADGDPFGSEDAWRRIDAGGTADDEAGGKASDKTADTP